MIFDIVVAHSSDKSGWIFLTISCRVTAAMELSPDEAVLLKRGCKSYCFVLMIKCNTSTERIIKELCIKSSNMQGVWQSNQRHLMAFEVFFYMR